MHEWMNDNRRAALRAICDTVVPAIEHADDADGFWARRATDVGADQAIVAMLAAMPPDARNGLLGLIDGLAAQGIVSASQLSREQILSRTAMLGAMAMVGINALTALVRYATYGLPDASGKNPFWKHWGYPGPVSAPVQAEKPIRPVVPKGDVTVHADVVVVGSGAGGGVMAGKLTQAGLKVVVLEAGGYFNESDFNQSEPWALQNLYWRGGSTSTADMNVSMLAAATLGGGTTVNWSNCLRTRAWVRDEWAREHGLDGVDGPDFERHLDAVSQRIGVNDQCSDLNGPNQRVKDGADKLGWSFKLLSRNADKATYDPENAGYMAFGDQSGSKLGTMRTYLQDAFDGGADIIVRCRADRVLVEGGRAAGVDATYRDPATGATAKVTVRAPRVVVAGGTLESPALLLRSGIGGPAVGNYLRLHPVAIISAEYQAPQNAWWGAPMTGMINEFEHPENGYGFLIQTPFFGAGTTAASMPFTTAAAHKAAMHRVGYSSATIGLTRDHGHGRITIDANGEAVPTYAVTDSLDIANLRKGVETQVRMHHAAGALKITALAAGAPAWRWGDDLEAYIARLQRIPFRLGGFQLFSAHQMGTCRMGKDPRTSVAGPFGELHDTPGVWIGDASAFPTSSGTNPMLSTMALAHRTAEAIIAARIPAASTLGTVQA
ncbi:FAD-dependent oxidoreductase [Ralstonia soli]|uniref:FAD-dependent oxidoreductase n=1 Tax=Ralstonia soli TaxID=2953896 RepID=A0ABT1AGJ6_9RALS|nr:FAD-dependent oxidoreductase [Ralstonia soli]MCO5397522.1 FAD-dependent oxidoreductase [Ralstonia soli]